jgi:hypothetical protein
VFYVQTYTHKQEQAGTNRNKAGTGTAYSLRSPHLPDAHDTDSYAQTGATHVASNQSHMEGVEGGGWSLSKALNHTQKEV